MKIQAINDQKYSKNIRFKRLNDYCKYGICALISSSSLFMCSNAIDSFRTEKLPKSTMTSLDIAASVFGITGTFMWLIGINLNDDDKYNKKRR